jgi:CMP-N-acetylneuraminic acid synthetase
MKPKFIALICARGGSKGLKNKNIKNFDGKPLIAWTILLAKKVKQIDRVIVSTESKKIANIARKYGAETPFLRPKELSLDHSPEWKVWKHAVNFLRNQNEKPTGIIILHATSPLRSIKDIQKCIKLFKKHKKTTISVAEPYRNPFYNMVKKKNSFFKLVNFKKKIRSRQLAPQVYDMTTVCWMLKPETIIKNNFLFDDKVVGFLVPKNRAVDIDDKYDFQYALLLKKKF